MNIDAVVGPTHHFGGLGVGNLASQQHRSQASNPRWAALAGLEKAELVAQLGVPQFFWLPPVRPRWDLLAQVGFDGPPQDSIVQALEEAPEILSAAFSSSFMWAANAATVTPKIDAADNRDHITPANLISSWHRSSEAQERSDDLGRMATDLVDCKVHPPLPAVFPLRDEGAANHMRLCDQRFEHGVNIFVYGSEGTSRRSSDPHIATMDAERAGGSVTSSRFLPRHTRAASRAIARMHRLNPDATFFLQQHPKAIDAGAFHNDVIATSHQSLLIHHQWAFQDAGDELLRIEDVFLRRTGVPLKRIEVMENELSLNEAVESYFFNSQLLSVADGSASADGCMVLICPRQCQQIVRARKLIERLIAEPAIPIDAVHYVDVGESMANGGGPACLRLRWCLETGAAERLDRRFRVNSQNLDRLRSVIETEYPERCELTDFANPAFLEQAQLAQARLRHAVFSLS
jgi:succinylarginine dihydrolase